MRNKVEQLKWPRVLRVLAKKCWNGRRFLGQGLTFGEGKAGPAGIGGPVDAKSYVRSSSMRVWFVGKRWREKSERPLFSFAGSSGPNFSRSRTAGSSLSRFGLSVRISVLCVAQSRSLGKLKRRAARLAGPEEDQLRWRSSNLTSRSNRRLLVQEPEFVP